MRICTYCGGWGVRVEYTEPYRLCTQQTGMKRAVQKDGNKSNDDGDDDGDDDDGDDDDGDYDASISSNTSNTASHMHILLLTSRLQMQ